MGSKLLVFGGADGEGSFYNNLSILDLEKYGTEDFQWVDVSVSSDVSPSPRSRHTLSYLSNQNLLLLIGGGDASGISSDACCVFDIGLCFCHHAMTAT